MIALLWKLFFTFFKIGLFTFGGGYAMVPLMQEQVLAHGWATEAEIINFIAVTCDGSYNIIFIHEQINIMNLRGDLLIVM